MYPATRYTFRRNIASRMKILFILDEESETSGTTPQQAVRNFPPSCIVCKNPGFIGDRCVVSHAWKFIKTVDITAATDRVFAFVC